jgi:hypothetical protein
MSVWLRSRLQRRSPVLPPSEDEHVLIRQKGELLRHRPASRPHLLHDLLARQFVIRRRSDRQLALVPVDDRNAPVLAERAVQRTEVCDPIVDVVIRVENDHQVDAARRETRIVGRCEDGHDVRLRLDDEHGSVGDDHAGSDPECLHQLARLLPLILGEVRAVDGARAVLRGASASSARSSGRGPWCRGAI